MSIIYTVNSIQYLFSAFSKIGEKSSGIPVAYFIFAVISLGILVSYFRLAKKIEPWLVVLFSSVFVVNSGYYILSVSKTLSMALWANRISYLGSVFLPFAVLMAILKVAKSKSPKWLPYALFTVAILVFLVAASPGILDIYYKEVSLGTYNGSTVLIKVYGPWHVLYLFYLMGYMAMTALWTIRTAVKKRVQSGAQTFVLVASAFMNIGVWLLEQLVKIDFELLSVSYIISEVFLLCLFIMIQEPEETHIRPISCSEHPKEESSPTLLDTAENISIFKEGLKKLTPAETNVYNYYVEGKSTKEIMALLNITENTLKYHNKNLYSKLGVSSRKQLLEIAKSLYGNIGPTNHDSGIS